NGSTSSCEPLTVGKADTTLSTDIHDAAHNVITSAALGDTVHDSTTLSGKVGTITPTGSASFTFYPNGSCTAGTGSSAGSASLVYPTAHPSSDEGPLSTGSYSFKATYGGDGNYNGSTSSCEPLTVGKADTTLSTDIHDAAHNVITSAALGDTVHDSATLSGKVGTITPTGSVSFTFYPNGSCTAGTGSSAGSASLVYPTAHPSSDEGPLSTGSYSFKATYGGHGNYNGSTSSCDPLTVGKADTTLSTHTPYPARSSSALAALGDTVHDSATLSGKVGTITPTGSVSFTFYPNGSCTAGTGSSAG